jgi:excisionase family DNA binding protein
VHGLRRALDGGAVSLFIVEFTPDVAGHLAVAVELYRRELRNAKGWAGPDQLDTFGKALQSHARERLQPTAVAALAGLLEDGGMVPLLVPKKEAARILGGVSLRSVDRLIADGHLPAVTVGGRVLVRRSDLEAFVDRLPPSSFRETVQSKGA